MKVREATVDDVKPIVGLLSADELGCDREDAGEAISREYYEAFRRIAADPNQELVVAEDDRHVVVGTLQISYIQYLTYRGGLRAQIEGVRVREDKRGGGLGKQLLEWAIGRAKEQGAHVVQLTSDKRRPDAIAFYERLGFTASHEGMKLHCH